MVRFADRRDAGQQLARELAHAPLVDPIVLALPRGGVPVGFEVAQALRAPLDVFVVRKIGAPGHKEYAIGAVAEGGTLIFDAAAVQALEIDDARLELLAEAERAELDRRVRRYRGDRPLPDLAGRDVVLVDDGLATGLTAEAAVRAVKDRAPRRVIVAVPACAPESRDRLAQIADGVVHVIAPPEFHAVGQWYDRFDQTSDTEVTAALSALADPTARR